VNNSSGKEGKKRKKKKDGRRGFAEEPTRLRFVQKGRKGNEELVRKEGKLAGAFKESRKKGDVKGG